MSDFRLTVLTGIVCILQDMRQFAYANIVCFSNNVTHFLQLRNTAQSPETSRLMTAPYVSLNYMYTCTGSASQQQTTCTPQLQLSKH